jgi:hypothetical protein
MNYENKKYDSIKLKEAVVNENKYSWRFVCALMNLFERAFMATLELHIVSELNYFLV